MLTNQLQLNSMCVHAQSLLTLCNLMDCSPPSSDFPGKNIEMGCHFLLQESSRPWDRTWVFCVSCIGRWILYHCATSVQFSSLAQSCPTLCDPMDCSMLGVPVCHQLPEFTQSHVHWVSDAIQPSHPLSSPSSPTFNHSQHQGLFKWESSSHQVAKVLEFQL